VVPSLLVPRLLTTQEAAARAGVGPTAIKRWADQGLLKCERTAGGHRRIAESALLELLRTQASSGDATNFVDALRDAESNHLVEGQLLLWRGQEGTWSGAAARIGAVLTEIGARWARGELSIIDEHVMSERLQRALSRIAESIPVPPRAPLAILAAVEGDQHVLGLSIVELCLRESGLRTRWAGHTVPAGELIDAIAKGGVQIAAVSASSASSDEEHLARYARKVGNACAKHGVELWLGGSGAWPQSLRHGVRLTSFEALREHLTERERQLDRR
jgi:excisionase family DNA binding protein